MKKRVSPFVAVLPVVISCTKPLTNPPPQDPISGPSTQDSPNTKPAPDPKPLTPQFPPTQYSKREKSPDGKCYVQIYANPPYNAPVSCTAPIEPPKDGSQWCTVESATDASRKVNVLCESK